MALSADTMGFDRYERLTCLTGLLDTLDPGREWRILDVGGYPGALADHAPARAIWTLDRPPCARERYLRGDGTRLPFGDGAFQAVIASDTLEHIPAGADRERFLGECLRVTGAIAIVSGPFDTPGVAAAERAVDGWHRRLFGRPHHWLDEHLQAGLPALAPTLDTLRRVGAAGVRSAPQGDLVAWLLMMLATQIGEALPGGAVARRRLDDAANRFWSGRPGAGLAYRQIVVAAKDDPGLLARLPWPARGVDDGQPDAQPMEALIPGLDAIVSAIAEITAASERPIPPAAAEYIRALEGALRDNARGGVWRRLAGWFRGKV